MTYYSLGFGTAPILGRIGKRQSWAALDKAYTSGIRHFDTARSYGWGEAEELLGNFLSQYRRESYTLVSKCGILPTRRSPLKSFAKAIGRPIYHLLPASRHLVKQIASNSFQPTHTYDVETLRFSFEQSLKALRTDFLDVILLHNYQPERSGLEAVVTWFQQMQKLGKIRRYGFSIEGDLLVGLQHLDRAGLLEGSVIQTPMCSQLFALPQHLQHVSFFVHSPFRFLQNLRELNPTNEVDIITLFAQMLATLNQTITCEVVIASMFTSDHIQANSRAAVLAAQISPETVAAFRNDVIDILI
jgi:hypothetical protein